MDYDVIQPNKELRKHTRQQLKGVWGKMAFAFFILSLLHLPYYTFSALDSLHKQMPNIPSFPIINSVLSIAMLITSGPLALGFVGYFLRRIRGEEFATKNIFDGFSRFLPSLLLMFFTWFFTSLWTLLLVIPGIIKGLGYSMAFYIMYDDPEIKPLEALKKSQIMMKGYKRKLFLLELSFIGWILLGSLTLCVGYLWLYPYICLSITNFYENLKRTQENNMVQTGQTS